ncbi:unnamed protein product [Haemonchus placei]|uniref:CHK domain-containing protein n=1 Tax=Haemonchus placei TaxID=6290 RepID=A0A158QRE2_HAEPC|nr:unnamed protein product [Haemonchus placei]
MSILTFSKGDRGPMGCRPSTPEVVTVTPPDPPPSDVPSDPPPMKPRSYRPSIASLQIPNQDDMSSEGMRMFVACAYELEIPLGRKPERGSVTKQIKLTDFECLTDRSTDRETEQENQDYLCGTDVSLQWLLQMLADKFTKQFDEEPQWITERLNRPRWDDYATSTVLRVTFGWEDEDLPKSVVLKTPAHNNQKDDEEAKYHYLMFKRECNVYDWTQKYAKLPSPRIFHIKRHTKEFSGVVVMEDIGERGVQQDAIKGLSVEAVRDLLQQLAVLHTISMKHTGWNTTVADLPPSYYTSLVYNYNDMVDFFEHHDVDHSRFVVSSMFD